jgi:hypothetical protein
MRAFICRTPDVDAEQVQHLMDLLQGQYGPITFINAGVVKVQVKESGYGLELSWEEAFRVMREERNQNELEPGDALFMLTDVQNEANFFAFGEGAGTGPGNHCIMVDGWDQFAVKGFVHPTLHIIASNLIQGMLHRSMDEWMNAAHQQSRGCISDFCQNKTDILLRLRTADLCDACVHHFNAAIENGRITAPFFHQCMQLVELARTELCFHKRMQVAPFVSPLEVRGDRQQIWLTGLDRELKIAGATPRCLYLLYLKHPEGIPYERLDEHIDELIEIHQRIRGTKTYEALHAEFMLLLDPGDRTILNQQVSRLRSSLRNALGDEVLPNYIWSSSSEKKAIPIAAESGMVSWRR